MRKEILKRAMSNGEFLTLIYESRDKIQPYRWESENGTKIEYFAQTEQAALNAFNQVEKNVLHAQKANAGVAK